MNIVYITPMPQFPITTDNLKEMTTQLQKQLQTSLEHEVRIGVARPEYIYDALREKVKESIEKGSVRTDFHLPIASYNGLHRRFKKEHVETAALEMGREYMAKHFPCAQTVTINYDFSLYSSTPDVLFVNIHFTLPWLSNQTSNQTQSK